MIDKFDGSDLAEDPSQRMLEKARRQYELMSDQLQLISSKLAKDGSTGDPKLDDTIRIHSKSLLQIFGLEMEIEKRKQGYTDLAAGYAIDLEAARTEVERRLACLRAP
jgi:hypothetical protein